MIYFIQVTLYTGILYLVYLMFLKNRADHNWSRAYLLLNMVVPFVLPFVTVPVSPGDESIVNTVMLPVITVGADISERVEAMGLLPIIYISVAGALAGYLLAQVVQITMFIRKHDRERAGNVWLIKNTSMGPGSWFRYVFIPGADADEAVLEHEIAHVRHGHSYDIVMLRLLQCLAWPNMLLWLIGKELKIVHEFQADADAGKMENYGSTLLNELFHTKHFALSHTFFHHPIKRRIMMLQTKSRAGKVKIVMLSLVLTGAILFVQCSKESVPPKTETGKIPAQTIDAAGVFNYVEKMPEFPGDLSTYLGEHIKYPKEAKDKKIEGRVVVKFVVDEAGNVKDAIVVNAPVNEMLSAAALDVINKMPKWTPGENKGKKVKVYYTLPISYKMAEPEAAAPADKG